MIIRRASDHKKMPWANGAGITTELWRVDDEHGAMLWRLSMAEVASNGPFSRFDGVDRVIGHIDGGAMTLTGPRTSQRLTPDATLAFAGEEAITADISAPCRDFNLMLRRGQVTGNFRFLRQTSDARLKMQAKGDETAFVFVIEGRLQLDAQPLHPHDLALFSGRTVILSGAGRLVTGSVILLS